VIEFIEPIINVVLLTISVYVISRVFRFHHHNMLAAFIAALVYEATPILLIMYAPLELPMIAYTIIAAILYIIVLKVLYKINWLKAILTAIAAGIIQWAFLFFVLALLVFI